MNQLDQATDGLNETLRQVEGHLATLGFSVNAEVQFPHDAQHFLRYGKLEGSWCLQLVFVPSADSVTEEISPLLKVSREWRTLVTPGLLDALVAKLYATEREQLRQLNAVNTALLRWLREQSTAEAPR